MIRIPETHATDLERLMTWKASSILSLYMPVETAGPDKRQNPVRFRNLLGSVKELLKADDVSDREIDEYLDPLREAFAADFWDQAGKPGFACFYEGPGHEPLHWFLSEEVPSIVTLHSRVHLKPLMDCWTRDQPFLLLTLDHEHLALYRGDAIDLTQLDDPDLPTTAWEALGEETEVDSVQFHTGTPESGRGQRAAVFHGQGDPGDARDERMDRFFQRVADPVANRVRRERLPLVLCGPPEVLSVYRRHNRAPGLLDEAIERHPRDFPHHQLRQQASDLVRSARKDSPDRALQRYKELVKELRVADSVDTVLPLARSGRVEHLFVAGDHEVWGRFDPDTLRVEHQTTPTRGAEDLLDTSARQVYETGGQVHILTDREVAEHTGSRHVAAILRPSG